MTKLSVQIDEVIAIFDSTLLTKAVEAYTKEYREMVGRFQHVCCRKKWSNILMS